MRGEIVGRDNLRYLAVALLALLALVAVAEQTAAAWGRGMVQGGFLLVLSVAMWTVRERRGLFRIGLGILGALILTTMASYWLGHAGVRFLQLGLLLGLIGGIAWLAFKQVLFTAGPIDANRLFGAISIYFAILAYGRLVRFVKSRAIMHRIALEEQEDWDSEL